MTEAENPKTVAGRAKPDATVISPFAMLWITAVMEFGAKKYGPFNWRDKAIPTRTYIAAMQRHMDEYESGVDRASDSRLPHLAHIAASCIILMDAEQAGTLHDDRFKSEGFEAVMNEIVAIKAGWEAAEAA